MVLILHNIFLNFSANNQYLHRKEKKCKKQNSISSTVEEGRMKNKNKEMNPHKH